MTTHSKISVFAPATVANVGPGFDVLGLAIDQPGDTVHAHRADEPGCRLLSISGDEGKLPLDANRNTASASVIKLLEDHSPHAGINLELEKAMPLGSGLGSSAASTAAALVAANALLGEPLSRMQLLPYAMEGERVACGVAHADNVAPALLGGIVLVRAHHPLDVISLPVPDDLWCVVVHPNIEVRTEDARKVLRKNVPLESVIQQCGNIAALVSGLFSNDYDLIGRALHDVVVEPHRSLLIPGFAAAKAAAREAGALGTSISGSGPSIFSLCQGEDIAQRIGQAKAQSFISNSIEATVYCSQVNSYGARIL